MAIDPGASDSERQLFNRMRELYDAAFDDAGELREAANSFEFQREEMRALTDHFLAEGFSEDILSQLTENQMYMRRQQQELVEQIARHQIEPAEYLVRVNELIDQTYSACERLIGPENCVNLMGGTREEMQGLIDPQIFFGQFQQD